MIQIENRLTEEIVVRGAIDTLRAHRYNLTSDEAERLVEILGPYGDPEGIVDDINEALAYLGDADEPDFEQAACYRHCRIESDLGQPSWGSCPNGRWTRLSG